MIKVFEPVISGIRQEIDPYYTLFHSLEADVFQKRRNIQGRTIKEIIGHMVDSASNNTHRIIHLQYRESPMDFPNYATEGNNDRWITIQNYQEENWEELLNLWRAIHLHIIHVITQIDQSYLENSWISGPGESVTLREMVIDFLRHFKLHLNEIDDLINQ